MKWPAARDGGRVEVSPDATGIENLTALVAKIENLVVAVHRRARVIVNERTGTIVIGKDVRLGAVSDFAWRLFGADFDCSMLVSQPNTDSQGEDRSGTPRPKCRQRTARPSGWR